MAPVTMMMQSVQAAAGLAGVLSAASTAFEAALTEIRAREDPASPAFAALVMAAASAADGRDAVLLAPSLPWPPAQPTLLWDAAGQRRADQGEDDLAAVFRVLASRLDETAGLAADRGDVAACRRAAEAARTAGDLLSRGSR